MLRCLCGNLYDIDVSQWFKMDIPHLTPLLVKILNGELYPDFGHEIREMVLDVAAGT